MARALFLDRDGTVNIDSSYINDPSQVRLFPRAGEAIARFNRAGFTVVLVTNQSGIGRGYFPEKALHRIHDRLHELLAARGAQIDHVYYAPYYENAADPRHLERPDWRKPAPGMLLAAAREHHIDLGRSLMVGDRVSDIRAGKNAGVTTVLVLTGDGEKSWQELRRSDAKPDYVFPDLLAAATFFCEDTTK